MSTKIAWTDESWNPVTGCTPVSEGCAHCYAKKMTERFGGDFSKVTLHPDRLEIPLHWRKPRMVFVPSMGDLFHWSISEQFIWRVFGAMALAEQHTFQVLTKRPERMREMLSRQPYSGVTSARGSAWIWASSFKPISGGHPMPWPLPNVWLGVSVENQARADERIPLLLETPAAVRFVSAEPLLGPLDLARVHDHEHEIAHDALTGRRWTSPRHEGGEPWAGLDWVIVGGESGGPPERRLVEKCHTASGMPYHQLNIEGEPPERAGRRHTPCGGTGWRPKAEALQWVCDIRDQCQAAGVPFFFKQWGPRAGQGTLLDGREHKEMP